jgi:PAS domain S-box-containing protein
MRVLLADDDAMSLHILTRVLTRNGFDPVIANNGAEAIDIVQHSDEPPRLAILDWMMPSADGLQVCRKIREHDSAHYTYVILLTSRNYVIDHLVAIEAGVDDYVTKPLNADELIAKLRIGQRVLAREDQLSRINRQWRAMVDAAPFAMACLSADGRVRRANRPFFDLCGGNAKQILAGNIWQSLLRDAPSHEELLSCIHLSKPFNEIGAEITRPDGSRRIISLWGRPVPAVDEIVYEVVTGVIS